MTKLFWTAMLAGGLFALTGCMGEAALESGLGSNGEQDPYAPCTDTLKCCPQSEMVCYGDPDKGVVCTCTSLWDCSKNPKKCEQDMQTPGGGTWECKWTESEYVCTGKPDSGSPPSGKNGWSCNFDVLKGKWVCKKTPPPNPSNKPDGSSVWDCEVDNELDKITCERKDDVPPGGSGGSADAGVPPGSGADSGAPSPDTGSGGPPSTGNKECVPGTKKWCDGLQYCGWGQVVCGPDGKWKRKFFGFGPLDCQELADGRRPNTKCACYHTFFNTECCETPDCIVPAGTNGQICPASPGQLCDYCNPLKPECKETGSHCIISSSNETFCGKGCGSGQACPTGYQCMSLTIKGSPTKQCVPTDLSCFH